MLNLVLAKTRKRNKIKIKNKNAIVADGRTIEKTFENAIKKLENAK